MLYDICAVQCVPCVQSGNGLPYPCAIYRYRKNQPSIDLPNGASINFMITRIKKSGTYTFVLDLNRRMANTSFMEINFLNALLFPKS
jgi:hypothetical protein